MVLIVALYHKFHWQIIHHTPHHWVPTKNISVWNIFENSKHINISINDLYNLKFELVGFVKSLNFKYNDISFWCSYYPLTTNKFPWSPFRKIWGGQCHFFKVHPILANTLYIDKQNINFYVFQEIRGNVQMEEGNYSQKYSTTYIWSIPVL